MTSINAPSGSPTMSLAELLASSTRRLQPRVLACSYEAAPLSLSQRNHQIFEHSALHSLLCNNNYCRLSFRCAGGHKGVRAGCTMWDCLEHTACPYPTLSARFV